MDIVLELFLKYIEEKGIKKNKVSTVDLKRDYANFNQVCLGKKSLSRELRMDLILWMVKENVPIKKTLKDELLAWVEDFKAEIESKGMKLRKSRNRKNS